MKNKHCNIFLIGPMGAGKTTIARQLAHNLQKTFIDTDHEIEKHTGVDISLIFEYEAEEGFRRREASMIAELTQRTDIILATGGGAVLDTQNRQHLKTRGIVIYLKASISALTQRTNKDPNRPLLQSGNAEEKIRELMLLREPLYEATADLTFDTSKERSNILIKKISDAINTLKLKSSNHDS